MGAPIVIAILGPNGAGKSSFWRRYLEPRLSRSGMPFINADEIAIEALGSSAPEFSYAAAEMAESQRKEMVRKKSSFAFESVFSDPVGAKLEFLCDAQSRGFTISAHFVGLDSHQLSYARVQQRVAQGGHDVPAEKLPDRYRRTMDNLVKLVAFADEVTIYDNSSSECPHRRVAYFQRGVLIDSWAPCPAWLSDLNIL